jgi:DNA polymerase III subunit epsilon
MQLQLSLAVADKLYETLLVRGEPIDAVEAGRALVASPGAPGPLCQEIVATLIHEDRRFCLGAGATGLVSLSHWETPDPDLADVPFVALDLETTGARAGISKITEIGAVRIEGFREVKHFTTLVNPLRPIPPMITRITGITQDMVADAPRIEDVIPELLEFIQGAVIVAHNASFDVGFLNYELRRLHGRKLGDGAIDTLPLARALAPGLPNYRLQTVAEAMGAPVTACHRALADAQAAGHVFVTLAGRLQELGVTRLSEARAYVSPSSRCAVEKLRLTRDVPKAPGTYCFVDKDDRILYVGKADRLRERVRAHFVANADHARKVRQAVRLVERIDWNETCTPLEAVVREQQLILEHRPACNLHGTRPEKYAYVKAGGAGLGLNLYVSSRAPKWLTSPSHEVPSLRQPLVIGPFRGRTRLNAALELLQHCYPVRRCPRGANGHRCVRGQRGRCLGPCAGDPRVVMEHDALVMAIVGWVTGRPDVELPDPIERAATAMRALSQHRRFEDAQSLREACEHLLSIRRSYRSLAEASSLRFAALWPQLGNGDGPSVRLNLVWNGRLFEPVSLRPHTLEEDVGAALTALWDHQGSTSDSMAAQSLLAVPQKELDSLLAIRHWFHEASHTSTLPLPGPKPDLEQRLTLQAKLIAEACRILPI